MKKIHLIKPDSGGIATPGHGLHDGTPGMAATIDYDILESDEMSIGGERFWEAYWKTRHVYGGVSEGQRLENILGSIDDDVLEKMHRDMSRFSSEPGSLSEADANDIFGMIIFLRCLEKGDSNYDPVRQSGYEPVVSSFLVCVNDEYVRRQTGR